MTENPQHEYSGKVVVDRGNHAIFIIGDVEHSDGIAAGDLNEIHARPKLLLHARGGRPFRRGSDPDPRPQLLFRIRVLGPEPS